MSAILYLLVAAVAALLRMARKGRGKFRRYIRGNLLLSIALPSLAANTLTSGGSPIVGGRTYVSSVKATYSVIDWTPVTDAGPLSIGVAHGDYSNAEIEEWIEASTGSWDEADTVQTREIGRRLIRRIGTVVNTGESLGTHALKDGSEVHTKLGWILEDGQALKFWIYNMGSANVGGSAPQFNVTGHANLWPT